MTRTSSTPDQAIAAAHEPIRRKRGRPFKRSKETAAATSASAKQKDVVTTGGMAPPSIPFRSFKIALSVFKDQEAIPTRLDRTVWSNKLYSTNLRETLEAYRFLGLTDSTSAPTAEFAVLLKAFGTPSWPTALRHVIERAYRPLLAANISVLTSGGLLRTVRAIYGTQNETTRKCCNFFIHAAREAALDTGPFLLANARSRWTTGRRGKKTDGPSASDASASAGSHEEPMESLIEKLPSYDAGWSDDVKRLWFGAYTELVQRLKR